MGFYPRFALSNLGLRSYIIEYDIPMSLHCVKRSSTNIFCNRKSNNSYSRRCMCVQFTTGHLWFCILYGTNAQVQRTTSLQSTALLTFLTQCLTEKANVREVHVRLNRAIWTISDTRVATPLSWLQVLLSRFDTKRRCWELTSGPNLPSFRISYCRFADSGRENHLYNWIPSCWKWSCRLKPSGIHPRNGWRAGQVSDPTFTENTS